MKNKKAMFFSLMTISILSLFLLGYSFYSVVQDREAIDKRIKTMNNFVFSVEQDIPRKLYTSGFRILFLFEKEIIETGSYIANLDSNFEEAFLYGTINGEEQELMIGAKFQDIQDSLNQNGAKVNVEVSLLNPEISISQEDPWNVKVSFSSDLLIKDKNNLALWNRTYFNDVYIPVTSFEDPIYIVNTNGLVSNKINKTIYEPFVSGTDVSNLILHNKNSYYIESASAPGFLKRLQGNIEADENGIESLVYLPDLSNQGISIKDKSAVDYIYFSNNNPSSNNIQGMPYWFKLDLEHLDDYGVQGLVV